MQDRILSAGVVGILRLFELERGRKKWWTECDSDALETPTFDKFLCKI